MLCVTTDQRLQEACKYTVWNVGRSRCYFWPLSCWEHTPTWSKSPKNHTHTHTGKQSTPQRTNQQSGRPSAACERTVVEERARVVPTFLPPMSSWVAYGRLLDLTVVQCVLPGLPQKGLAQRGKNTTSPRSDSLEGSFG